MLKGHPNVPAADLPTAGYDVIVDSGADMNELLVASDVLVTDYSSAVFEYALLRRPIVLLVGDLEAYARDPGIAVDIGDLVGSRATDTDSAAAAILTTTVDPAAYDAFIARHVGACDGRSSERLAERIVGLVGAPQSSRA